MANPHELEKDADWFKRLAVWEESRKQYRSAAFYYTEAAQALLNSLEAGSKTEGLLELAQNYNNKVKELKSKTVVEDASIPNTHVSKSKADFARALFLLDDGTTEDEKGNFHKAFELYTLAVELMLSIVNPLDLVN
ncbi:unnamed protein product [Schistosoma mattheei]|uniref:MIT domain-containing protein n=1 Tax=Schistosoma mattheei TaxID=31246 RepID=A0AA85BQG3_9TREM|nr:unnamed protein product [Schistosoma mattheei]